MPHRETIQSIGNRAFAALAEVLDLPGTIHLGEVDISAAFPVIELLPVMQAAQTEVRRMYRQRDPGIGTLTFDVDPRTEGDWSDINGGAVITQGNVLVAEGHRAIPEDHDAIVLSAGMWAANSNFTNGIIRRRLAPGGGVTGAVGMGMAIFDARQGGPVFHADGPTLLVPLPWYLFRGWAQDLEAEVTGSASVNVTVQLNVLHGPPGTIPRHIAH